MPRTASKISTHKRKTDRSQQVGNFTKLSVVITTIIAMIAYSSFPLAYFLNYPYFWHGLVSVLTEPNQPYNWLFSGADIAASLFGIGFFSYLCWRENWDRLQSVALSLVVVASLAELLTDIFTLPANFVTTNGIPPIQYLISHPEVLTHGIASFLNSAAFVISFGVWVLHRRRISAGKLHRELMFALVILVSTVGSAIGYLYPATSPTLQRLFVLSYCYWFIALPLDSLREKPRLMRSSVRNG